eukprot:6487421-Amphidinium_carterae.1
MSKTDHLALGKRRTHGCSCPSLLCPVAAARRLHHGAGRMPQSGRLRMALLPGCSSHRPQHAVHGSTGKFGVDVWRIQVFGRWGSTAVMRYVREANVEQSVDLASLVCGVEPDKHVDLACDAAERAGEQVDVAHIAAEVVQTIEDKIGSGLATRSDVKEAMKEVEANVRLMILSPLGTDVQALPVAVCNTASERGLVHAPRTLRHTHCGWDW